MMAYTESEEDSIAYGKELLSLCPKGWAWLVGDCDEGVDCDDCRLAYAPIKAKEEFEREKRAYCAGCNVSLNCPVGQNNFKTCTRKGSNLIRLNGKHIPTYAEEKTSLASDSKRTVR